MLAFASRKLSLGFPTAASSWLERCAVFSPCLLLLVGLLALGCAPFVVQRAVTDFQLCPSISCCSFPFLDW